MNAIPANKWRNQLEKLQESIHIFQIKKISYQKIMEVLKLEGVYHEFWLRKWVHQVYQVDAAIALRRLVSSRKRDVSLKKFLENIRDDLRKRPGEIPNIAIKDIEKDIAKINRQRNARLNEILKLVDKDYAHHSADQSDISEMILMEDFFEVAQDLEDVFVKYYAILQGKEPELLSDNDRHAIVESIEKAFLTIGEAIKFNIDDKTTPEERGK